MGAIQLASMPDGTIVNNSNQLVAGASVRVYQHPTTPAYSTQATVYAEEALATILVQPLLSDAFGVVPGWCSTPTVVDIVATYGVNVVSKATVQLISTADVLAGIGAVQSFNGRGGIVMPVTGDYTAAKVTNAADKSGPQQVFAGEIAAPDVVASGLPGLIGARFVGGIASGPPTTGTFQLRDFVVDAAGRVFVCTTAGSPGAWTNAGGAGTAGVASFNARTGAVLGAAGDYTAAQVTNAADKVSTGVQTFTGQLAAPGVSAAGTSGLGALRVVGTTTSGAPTVGAFLANDVVLDLTGKWWVCTVSGTPGTWIVVNSGGLRESHVVAMDDQTVPSQPAGSVIGSIPVTIAVGQTTKLVGAYTKCTLASGSVFKVQCDHGVQGTLSDVAGLTALTPAVGAFAQTLRTGGSLTLSEGDEVAVTLVTPGASKGCKIAPIFEVTP